MTEAVRITYFDDHEGQALDSIRARTLEKADPESTARMEIKGEENNLTSLISCELFGGVRSAVQTIGPVDYITVWKSDGTRIVEAERQADGYIVYGPVSWRKKLGRLERATQKPISPSP